MDGAWLMVFPNGRHSKGDLPFPPVAFQTAGDASESLPFGLSMAGLERWALVYLALSSLVFVVVWVVGYLRR
jgi:hypothetical protein